MNFREMHCGTNSRLCRRLTGRIISGAAHVQQSSLESSRGKIAWRL
jgi:hypothetical protein